MNKYLKNGMVFFLLIISFFYAGSIACGAEHENSTVLKIKPHLTFNFGLLAGYRIDQLDWNIAGNNAGTNPNILSELTWKDLEIYQVQFKPSVTLGNSHRGGVRYHLRGMLGWGSIVDGSVQDSDYAGDDRTLEFSRSNNSADGGSIFDFSVGGGLELKGKANKWTIMPLAGFSYHEQNTEMSDGNQTVSEQAIANDFFDPDIGLPHLGTFEGLDSRYHAEWYGPWLGLELLFQPVDQWKLSSSFEYHWIDYYGEADWNLRESFAHPVSFRHWADGSGYVLGLELDRKLNRHWSCGLGLTYQDWNTNAGTDVTYLADGRTAGTRVNEVNWESFSMQAGVKFRF